MQSSCGTPVWKQISKTNSHNDTEIYLMLVIMSFKKKNWMLKSQATKIDLGHGTFLLVCFFKKQDVKPGVCVVLMV